MINIGVEHCASFISSQFKSGGETEVSCDAR